MNNITEEDILQHIPTNQQKNGFRYWCTGCRKKWKTKAGARKHLKSCIFDLKKSIGDGSQKYFKYSMYYTKLQRPVHTTIRRYNKKNIRVGDICKEFIEGRGTLQKVRVTRIDMLLLKQMSDKLLCHDTDKNNRQAAIKLIESFYDTPIDWKRERFFVFTLSTNIDIKNCECCGKKIRKYASSHQECTEKRSI